jgi:hypothetical protein
MDTDEIKIMTIAELKEKFGSKLPEKFMGIKYITLEEIPTDAKVIVEGYAIDISWKDENGIKRHCSGGASI